MLKPVFLFMRCLQTIPIALLMFVPFSDQQLHMKRRTGYLFSVGYLLAACMLLTLVSAAASIGGKRNIVVRDISLAVVLVSYFFGWAHAVHAPMVCKTLVGEIMLHYAAILNAMSNALAAAFLGEEYQAKINADAGSPAFCLCLLAVTAITFPLIWCFLRYILRENLHILDEHESKRGLAYLCAVFILFCLATYNPRYELKPEIPLFIAALVITDMIAYYIFFRELGTVRRQAETVWELEVYQMQYQQISQVMEETRRLRHDLRHHLNMLGALNAQGKQEEIRDYLQQYGTVYHQLEKQKYSGDPVIDSVLKYYLTQAGEAKIPVDCWISLEGSSHVDAMDMTVLLSNCLENALEALRPLSAEKRKLWVEIVPTGMMLLICIRNTCGSADNRDFTGWKAFPSQKHSGRKGVGLRSITTIAEKYGGYAQFQRKDGQFTARISLNMRAEEQQGMSATKE